MVTLLQCLKLFSWPFLGRHPFLSGCLTQKATYLGGLFFDFNDTNQFCVVVFILFYVNWSFCFTIFSCTIFLQGTIYVLPSPNIYSCINILLTIIFLLMSLKNKNYIILTVYIFWDKEFQLLVCKAFGKMQC